MIKYFLSICILFFTIISKGQPLSNTDLSFISKSIENKSIIGLGEPEHFFKGYYNLKIQILKYLILKDKIDEIAFEASSAEFRKLDSFIKGASIDIIPVLPKLNAGYDYEKTGLLDCKEIVDFLKWLRKENYQRKNKISVYGIDFQNTATPVEQIKLRFKDDIYIKNNLDTLSQDLFSLLKQLSKDPMSIYMDSSWKKMASKNYSLSNEFKNYISHRNTDKWINQYANELSQFAYIFTDPNFQRDKLMFQNFLWHFNPKKTTVIWAAYFHIVNDSLVNKGGIVPKLGAFLSQKFGSEYFKIGLVRTKNSIKDQAQRIIYPLSKNDENYMKFDMLIKCRRGETATPISTQ